MSTRRFVLLVSSMFFGCASSPGYVGPAIDAPGTVRVEVRPWDPGAPFGTATTTVLDVYDTGGRCPKAALDRASPAYRGLIDAGLLRGAFTVPSGGFVFFTFRVSAVVSSRFGSWRCEVPFGFRPTDGVAYTLEIGIPGPERCVVDLYDDANRRLPLTSPETCEPWWAEGHEGGATSP